MKKHKRKLKATDTTTDVLPGEGRMVIRAELPDTEREVIEAAGTSEGARKAAETKREQGWNHLGSYEGGKVNVWHKEYSTRFGKVHRIHVDDGEPETNPIGFATKEEAVSRANKYIEEAGYKKDASTKATEKEIVSCRASGSPILAKKTWEVDQPAVFMWMPGGTHTIHASYGRSDGQQRPIELTVNCTKAAAESVQSSFEAVRAANPRRPPFICIEHKAQERAGEPIAFEWRDEPEPAIYCRCMPSALGVNNVNGKIHTSFSPTFDTDADYGKMRCSDCDKTPSICMCNGASWYFPPGVRGSSTNPAMVTAADVQSVGSLTNWNAFRTILPIAAREREQEVIEAAETDVVMAAWSDAARAAAALARKHGWKKQKDEWAGTDMGPATDSTYHHPDHPDHELVIDHGGHSIRPGERDRQSTKRESAFHHFHKGKLHKSGSASELEAHLFKFHKRTKASDTEGFMNETIQAAGTSEGAAKGWLSRVRVVHPHPDFEHTAVHITDVKDSHDFAKRWEKESNDVQGEFGFDLPLHGKGHSGYMPRKEQKMSYSDYVDLVKKHSKTQLTAHASDTEETTEIIQATEQDMSVDAILARVSQAGRPPVK